MGWLSDAYNWVDKELLGGVLPGGHDVSRPGATIGGIVPTPFVGVEPVAAPVAGAGLFGAGGAVAQAAAGLPVAAPVAVMPRGKMVTAVARVLPNGQIIPVRMLPGTPVSMSSDISAVRRAKSAQKRLNKLFPKSRGSSTCRASKKKR